MQTSTHGNGNGLNDLYILPESEPELWAAIEWLRENEIDFSAFISAGDGDWYGAQCLEVVFGERYAEPLRDHLAAKIAPTPKPSSPAGEHHDPQ